MSIDALAEMQNRGVLGIVAQNVENPWERWGLGEPAQGGMRFRDPAASVNTEYHVKIAPRCRVSNLQLSRERSRNIVSGFLEHPLIDHKRGGYQYANAAFGARRVGENEPGPLCAVTTLTRPSATELCKGMTFDLWDTPSSAEKTSPNTTRTVSAGRTRELTRYASHPDVRGGNATDTAKAASTRRENTASWLISHALEWAALEGYETVVSYSGVANQNEGTIYKAANFQYAGTVDADGDGWTNRSKRDSWSNSREKSRWIAKLRPEGNIEPRANRRDSIPVAEFSELPDNAPSVGNLRMTREETIQRDFGRAANFLTEYGTFSDTTPVIDGFCTCSAEKLSECTCNPAIFGANYNDKLIAAIGGREDPQNASVFHVGVHADSGTAYPTQTAGWLLAKLRDWAHYEGYQQVTIPAGILPSHAAGTSVGFTVGNTELVHTFDSPLPAPTRDSHRESAGPHEYYR
ncbi:hypothetical protein [Salinibaculum rarum]|uniref:hypothetical protein n=1 Tax=Salinibaculum rarum TaxID=3058903 RepID=UPI00265FB9D5|nr:hypothetical protein [Salinibaculum sp. KK48]